MAAPGVDPMAHGSPMLWAYLHKKAALRPEPWPVRRPAGWEQIVQAALPDDELDHLRTSLRRGRPFGSESWVLQAARELGLGYTLRDRGRPKKMQE